MVVGTRSAVFAPCRNLGIIILDEEQEHSYKSENTPPILRQGGGHLSGNREKALVLLGSATPSVETMYRARTGVYTLCRLAGRFNGMALPQVRLVDMKEEIRAGNDSVLSRPLLQAMEETMARGEQTILFPEPPGRQPDAPVCELRPGAGMPPVQRAPHLPQRQSPADVPLLRLFPAGSPHAAPSAAAL